MENEKAENTANHETEQNFSIAEYQQPVFTSIPVEESVIKAAQQKWIRKIVKSNEEI